MKDMSSTIIAKSDQINAADIIGNPITMTVREVQIKAAGSDDQPVSIFFEGEKKAFRPCKGVRRLLVHAWGSDANSYIGRALTLFCDPSVTWAGKEEGGLRVSHMSNIEGEFVFSMRTSRASTKPYKIKPLAAPKTQTTRQTPDQWATAHIDAIDAAVTTEDLDQVEKVGTKALVKLAAEHPDLHAQVVHAYTVRRSALSAFEGPATTQRDEIHNGSSDDIIAEIEDLADADLIDGYLTVNAEKIATFDPADGARIQEAAKARKALLAGDF